MSLGYYQLLAIPIDSIEINEQIKIYYKIISSNFAAEKRVKSKHQEVSRVKDDAKH